MDFQILISILWLSCSVQGQQEPDVIITSSEPSIGKVLKSLICSIARMCIHLA